MTAESCRNAFRTSLTFLAFLTLAQVAHAVPAPAIAPDAYEVTQLNRLTGQGRPTYNLTARPSVYNPGSLARAVTASLTGGAGEFTVLDGEVRFGQVPRTPITLACPSIDTFRIRFVLPADVHPDQVWSYAHTLMRGLTWQVACSNCGTNRPPVANAGADQSTFAQQLATLDGSASSDPDGNAITYAWSILNRPAGSSAALAGATTVRPTLTPDREGDYTIQLVVHDGQVASAPDTVVVSTLNSAPVASAGADQTAFVSQRVQLDGSGSSDVDGDALTYAWEVAQRPSGSTAQLERPADVNPAFVPDETGQYVIELVVDDGTVSSAPDTMVISTENTPPVANAGTDQTTRVDDTATLDGSGSRDADGDPLTYRWSLSSRPANSNTSLQGTTTASPTLPIDRAGTYVAQLIVNDGQADSDADTVSVSTINSPPIAVPGPNRTVHFGATVGLDGSGSRDPDGDGLTFAWALLAVPEDSTAALSDANALAPTFVADRPGTYVVQLIVNDGTVNSAPASLTVTAQNAAPIARDDAATTPAGTAVTVNVLANDTDADPEDTLRVSSVTQPANGAATFTATNVTYTPNTGFSGSDTFTYRITDGADFAVATVSITVQPPANTPPIADAGPDQSGFPGDVFGLDGRASRDPDGTPLTFAWTQVAGPAATLSGADTATPQLTTTAAGTYRISLTVSDGTASASDEVAIGVAPLPGLSIEGTTLTEGNAGTTTAMFRVTLSAPINRRVTATYSTQDDSATSGADYTPASGTIAFEPGETQPISIDVTVLGDTIVEPDETFSVALSSPVNAVLAVARATGTISNDDTAPVGAQVEAFGPSATVVPESTARMNVILDRVAGAGGVLVTLTSSNGAAATVPNELLVPEGELSATVDIIAGPVVAQTTIQAAVGSGPARSAQLFIATETSSALIDAAQAAGTLSAEQAFVYRVLAEFGSSALPPQYRGAASPGFDMQVFFELGDRFDALNAEQRAAIEPYLLPPYYEGSWAEAVLGEASESPLTTSTAKGDERTPSINVAPGPGGLITVCREGANTVLTPFARTFDTTNFRIWFPEFPAGHAHFGDNARARRVAEIVRDTAETALTALAGTSTTPRFRQPLRDGGIACNGGDTRIDVYLAGTWWSSRIDRRLGFSGNTAGYTMPYFVRSESTAAYMVLNYDHAYAARGRVLERTRSFFTHELMHAIDFAYAKQQNVNSYRWLKDAMGTWAMDFVWPGDDEEHIFAERYFTLESRYPLSFDHPSTTDLGYTGYSEYVFFFWAHRRYNGGPGAQPSLLMQVLVEAERLGSTDAIANALVFAQLGSGQPPRGFASAWPEFALAMWNDTARGVQSNVFGPDRLTTGIRDVFQRRRNWIPTEIEFGAPETDQEFNSGGAEQGLPEGGGGRLVAPLSTMYHHVVFPNDPNLALLVVDNQLADPDNAPGDDVVQRVDAFYLTEEGWQGPFDWTSERYPVFCFDERATRIRELVLVYTNSAPPPGAIPANEAPIAALNNWYWFNEGGEQFANAALMSEAACWRWRLSSSSWEDRGDGGVYRFNGSGQNVTLTRDQMVVAETPEGPVVQANFVNLEAGGTFTWEQNFPTGDCPLRVGPFSGPIAARDAAIGITLLSRDPLVRSRGVAGGGGSMAFGVPWESCDDSGSLDVPALWFGVSAGPQVRLLNPGGRDLTGVEVEAGGGRTVTVGYALSADRE